MYRMDNMEIVENYKGIQKLINLVEEYPKGTKFHLVDTTYGYAKIWVKLLNYFANSCNFKMYHLVFKWI